MTNPEDTQLLNGSLMAQEKNQGRIRGESGTGTSIHAFMCLKKMCIDEGISFAG